MTGSSSAAPEPRDLGLDALRVTAVALLLIAHGVAIFYALFPQQRLLWFLGCWGMDLFFVLGGYLLAQRVLDAAGRQVAALLRERALRILPNYILFLLVGVVLAWFADGEWRLPLRYWLFIQNLERPHPAFLPELWGLATAVSSGVLLLIVYAALLRRYGVRAALGLAVLLIVAGNLLRVWHVFVADPLWDEGVKKITLWRLDALAYGFLAAHLQRTDWLLRLPSSLLAAIAASLLALVFVLYAAVDENHSLFARSLLFGCDGLAFAALLLAVVGKPTPHATVLIKAVHALARYSYLLFLCHLPILRIMELFHLSRDNWPACAIQAISYVGFSLIVAALLYRCWERYWWPSRPGYSGR